MQRRVFPVPVSEHPCAALDRLGDEIAELSAHLDAATARLLGLIREFDARGAGMGASAPVRPGSPGGWGSTWARPASGCGWHGRSGHSCVAGIPAPSTRRAIRSRAGPMGRSASGGRMAGRCLKCHWLPW
jgi:hypothetical protein